jgi:hypothetical protein
MCDTVRIECCENDEKRFGGLRERPMSPAMAASCTNIAPALEPAEGRALCDAAAPRVELNEENVGKGLAQLVLTVVRVVHELLEKQALRRMDAGSLTSEEIERLGRTLQAQAQEIKDMAERFDLTIDDLNLDLGPLGKAL